MLLFKFTSLKKRLITVLRVNGVDPLELSEKLCTSSLLPFFMIMSRKGLRLPLYTAKVDTNNLSIIVNSYVMKTIRGCLT